MSLTPSPEANSAPPVENWMIPSLPASAKPLRAALRGSDPTQLTAGKANDWLLAVSIIWRYACGVAIGMGGSLFRSGTGRAGGESGLWGCEVFGSVDRGDHGGHRPGDGRPRRGQVAAWISHPVPLGQGGANRGGGRGVY